MKHQIPLIVVFSFLILLLGRCKNDPIVPSDDYFKTDCDTSAVTYTNFVASYIVEKNCVLCHTDNLGYIPYVDIYDSLISYVSDSAAANYFIEKISTNHMIIDSALVNTECELAHFRTWIREGAPY